MILFTSDNLAGFRPEEISVLLLHPYYLHY